ncbi:PREDICTED: TBC1 domain family member 30-like isoform X2 [Priapulus caudatus]|uniref:TBC1 domain family member 30-like isoform X2 n=1 Tax=Priapulus caudatus TaxID=37621 RepID=A0ABM1EXY6_PRICU|nr:PREDICTED: TBC1 domain family member 30-like isoform X2 [Priapulus caudatus]
MAALMASVRDNFIGYFRTGEDTRIRFSVEPTAGEEGFQQWKHALKAVARLPMGIPHEFRRKIWLRLAEDHIRESKLDWEKTKRVCFNERSNPDDNKLGRQIVKDLHRTGWNGFSGQEAEDDRATLKRVLLAYARFNKAVGYCQGFNVLAGLILDVVERKEDDALKIMIFVIGHVLPQSYFSNNLRALSVDMAVFRDLLRLKLPQLARHLDHLQDAAKDSNGSHYEPPLTNVFTMQWFLTLFATCLQKSTVLRVWDSILLEGSEVILRTALAIWGKLSPRIQGVDSADQFYGTMGLLMQEMLELNMIDCKDLLAEIYSMAPFPFPEVTELREKYTYNITPLHSTAKRVNIFSDDETEMTEDDMAATIGCFTGMIPPTQTPLPRPRADDGHILDIQSVTPGALSPQPDMGSPWQQSTLERTTMDITTLRKQYGKLRERQAQAQIILAGAHAQRKPARERHQHQRAPPTGTFPPMTGAPIIINHLYLSNSSGGRGRGVRSGRGGVANPCHGVRTMQPSQRDRHGLVEARNGTQADVSTPAHASADVPSQGDRHGLVEARNGTQADVGAPAYATADFPSQDGETEDSVEEGENSRRGDDDDDNVQRTRSATCPAAAEPPSDDGEATAASEGGGGWGGGAAAGLANVKPRRTTSVSICEPLSSQRPTTKSTHYPFPRRHSLQRSNVCMQLGMYGHRAGVVGAGVACGGDPSSRHVGDAAEPGVTEIKASHINQCLHRQYMAQIKVERN